MTVAKCNKKLAYISIPSGIIASISLKSSLLLSSQSKKKAPSPTMSSFSLKLKYIVKNPSFWFFLIFLSGFCGMLKNRWDFDFFTQSPRSQSQIKEVGLANSSGLLSATGVVNEKEEEEENVFWKQPDGLGYRPCLQFSREYRNMSNEIFTEDKRAKYLMVVVSGGMNQQRNEIVDAVVIARILGAALVVPVLQVNPIWGDQSEFADIFDLDHFKKVLANDVRIVSSLPSTHLTAKPPPVLVKGKPLYLNSWGIRSRYLSQLTKDGILILRGLDSVLSKDLPSDLQKLRCKVAFHSLKFVPTILEIGNMLTERMRSKGPYLALHLRLEKDVWVRTGCLPGLGREYDEMIYNERKHKPELLTSRFKFNMTYHERQLGGLCHLNALEVARLIKALGAPKAARIYWAGGAPLGGKEALKPLTEEFPHFYNKEDLALPGELDEFVTKASSLAAIDFIVSKNSDVFLPSHGGNMGHAVQGHRAYAGHKKTITPNKRKIIQHFSNTWLSEAEFSRIIRHIHRDSMGQPVLRTAKSGRDVTKYPVPECMCSSGETHLST